MAEVPLPGGNTTREGGFEVTVKEVRHRLPAAIDDEVAQAVGLDTLAELRQEIRQRMQRDYDGIARQQLKRALLDKLAEQHDFPVPPGMVEMEFNSIWGQYQGERQFRQELAARQAAADAAGEGPVDAGALVFEREIGVTRRMQAPKARDLAAHPHIAVGILHGAPQRRRQLGDGEFHNVDARCVAHAA